RLLEEVGDVEVVPLVEDHAPPRRGDLAGPGERAVGGAGAAVPAVPQRVDASRPVGPLLVPVLPVVPVLGGRRGVGRRLLRLGGLGRRLDLAGRFGGGADGGLGQGRPAGAGGFRRAGRGG